MEFPETHGPVLKTGSLIDFKSGSGLIKGLNSGSLRDLKKTPTWLETRGFENTFFCSLDQKA